MRYVNSPDRTGSGVITGSGPDFGDISYLLFFLLFFFFFFVFFFFFDVSDIKVSFVISQKARMHL